MAEAAFAAEAVGVDMAAEEEAAMAIFSSSESCSYCCNRGVRSGEATPEGVGVAASSGCAEKEELILIVDMLKSWRETWREVLTLSAVEAFEDIDSPAVEREVEEEEVEAAGHPVRLVFLVRFQRSRSLSS